MTDPAAWRADLRRRWYAEGWFGTQDLAQAFTRSAAVHPDACLHFAGSDHSGTIRLPELLRRGTAVATALRHRGLRAGDAVAVQVPNWVEGAVAYVAAMLLGAVVVPVIHIYGAAEVGFILRQSRARALIMPDRWRRFDYTNRLATMGPLPDLDLVVVIGSDVPAGAVAWAELEEQARGAGRGPDLATPTAAPDDIACLIYTSGTTGEPKGVRHSHNTLLAEVRSTAAWLGTAATDVSLGAFPAGHIAGVSSLLRSLVLGTSAVLLDAWDPHLAAAAVEQYRVGSTAGTPYFVTSILEAAERDGRDLSSLSRFMVGAANVPKSVVEMADGRGIAAYRAYGSTEHPTISSGNADDPLDLRASTDGTLTPGNEVRIVDDDGHEVASGSPGEIVSRGPEQFLGYSDPRFDQDSYWPEGWFRTGDIGVMEGRHLTIVDRKKDIIIRGGENIASKEVEDLLLPHPSVADAAAVAAPDARLGETVCAFAVLVPGATLDLEDVRRYFREAGVAIQKTPERLEVVADLPRGHGGKVQKVELRRRLFPPA